MEEALQPDAMKVAQQRGASELACPAATSELLSKRAVQEAQSTGWYEAPRRAEYTVAVSGCGKRTTYLVACNKFRSACEAGAVPAPTRSGALEKLAEELQPDALKAAQQRGARDFTCPTTTAEVTHRETIVEGQTTGWDAEAPHRAVYAVTVKGCEKQTAYLVECDKRKKACASGGLEQAQATPQHPQLADELQPGAVQTAQERGSKELECPAATAVVNRKATIDEGTTTGWYEAPFRAAYTITVAGCGKQTTYLVACNKKEKRCGARSPSSQ
ncbi:MAG TPA: hypothetical protein VI195_09465 [Steroidobacteraceae bacterium]